MGKIGFNMTVKAPTTEGTLPSIYLVCMLCDVSRFLASGFVIFSKHIILKFFSGYCSHIFRKTVSSHSDV